MTAGLDAAQKLAMLDAARPHLLRVLGLNCLGLLTPHLGRAARWHVDRSAAWCIIERLPGAAFDLQQDPTLGGIEHSRS